MRVRRTGNFDAASLVLEFLFQRFNGSQTTQGIPEFTRHLVLAPTFGFRSRRPDFSRAGRR